MIQSKTTTDLDPWQMDTDKGTVRPGGRGSRPLSPVKPPTKTFPVYFILMKGLVLNTLSKLFNG